MRNNYHGMHAGAKPELFRFAEQLRNNMTEAELILWEFFRTKKLVYKFRRQHPFDKYILDFYCHQLKLSIEIDGKYHEVMEQKILDEQRTKDITRLGITEIRFRTCLKSILRPANNTLTVNYFSFFSSRSFGYETQKTLRPDYQAVILDSKHTF